MRPLTPLVSRRTFGLISGAGLMMAISPSIASLTAEAQTAAKTYRIGILGVTPRERVVVLYDAFRQGLRQSGYAEGQQATLVDRHADGVPSRLPALAAELIRTMHCLPQASFARASATCACIDLSIRTSGAGAQLQ
jgi:hypothetical protein